MKIYAGGIERVGSRRRILKRRGQLAEDTHHFNLVIGGIKLPLPQSDEAFGHCLNPKSKEMT